MIIQVQVLVVSLQMIQLKISQIWKQIVKNKAWFRAVALDVFLVRLNYAEKLLIENVCNFVLLANQQFGFALLQLNKPNHEKWIFIISYVQWTLFTWSIFRNSEFFQNVKKNIPKMSLPRWWCHFIVDFFLDTNKTQNIFGLNIVFWKNPLKT